MSRLLKFVLIAVLVPVLLAFVVPLFFPWTELNCRHEDVDIRTGRLRCSRYFWFVRVSQRIEDSPLTAALLPETLKNVKPEWHRVNTFSPGTSYSPHYTYHGAIGQIRELSINWRMFDLPPTVREKTARHVLALWQHGRGDYLAGRYIAALSGLDDDGRHARLLDGILRLEMPQERCDGERITRTVFYPDGQAIDRVEGRLDADGKFIRHGVWESWYPDGKREVYGHFDSDEHHGRRFEWDRNGKLTRIEGFTRGRLTEFESENLERHPDYPLAQKLAAGTPP